MRVPDPKANTTTEAYLAYKAGYLEESELKPVLYEPYLHFDGWLAYWAGLVGTYPVKNVGKNLFDKNHAQIIQGYFEGGGTIINGASSRNRVIWLPCKENTTYTVKEQSVQNIGQRAIATTEEKPKNGTPVSEALYGQTKDVTFTTPKGASFIVIRFQSALETDIETLMQDVLDTLQIEEGSTASAYEPYTGEPEMLCDEEALVAYLAGATDTYPEEIKDPYDVRIVGYLKHLASIRWPEPDYPVNNEEFYLSTMEPTHTSNSEPSANIELDTANGKIISVEAYGDTYQQTYSGYNLIDLVPMTNTQPTRNQQCTFETVMDTTLGRNVLHITGTNNYPSVAYRLPQRLESGKYYALKFTYRSAFTGTASRQMWFAPNWSVNDWDVLGSLNVGRCKSGDGDTSPSVDESTAWKTTSRRFYVDPAHYTSVDSSYTLLCFSLGYNQNSSKELWLADAEVYEITEDEWNADTYTSKDYEPYSIPAPNPDYPQAVQTVTGEQTVTVTGKNLFDKVAEVATSPNYSLNPDGTITTNASNAQTGRRYMTLTMNPGTYTLSFRPYFSGVESPAIRFTIRNMDTSTDYIVKNINNPENGSLQVNSFTVENTTTVGFCIIPQARLKDGQNFYFYDTQLEQGSTVTAYESFKSQTYTIDFGSTELCKLGDYQDYIYKGADGWYKHEEVGKIIIDGNSSFGTYAVVQGDYYVVQVTGNLWKFNSVFVSDNFTYKPQWGTQYSYESIYYAGTSGESIGFKLLSSRLSSVTVDGAKAWFGAHNTTVYYQLKNPTDTKITDATLVGQLEALAGADTYNGKTFIKVTANDPNLPVLLKVEAYKY